MKTRTCAAATLTFAILAPGDALQAATGSTGRGGTSLAQLKL